MNVDFHNKCRFIIILILCLLKLSCNKVSSIKESKRNMKGVIGYFLLLGEILLSAVQVLGITTYYCEKGRTVSVDLSKEPVNIITRYTGKTFYDDNMRCSWDITAGKDQRIQVKVIQNHLQYAPDTANCNSYDHVTFMEEQKEAYFNWNKAAPGMYFNWCGKRSPYYFSSKDNNMFLEFNSNDRNVYDQAGVTMEVSPFDIGECPPGWTEMAENQTGYCYKIQNHEETWADSQNYCNKEKSNLVSFMDDEEAYFVTKLIQNSTDFIRGDNVWIGLNDIKKNSQYNWIDGINSTVTYRWMSVPHTSSKYDSCVSIEYYDGKWQVEYCTQREIQTVIKNKFVCKINKNGKTRLFSIPSEDKDGEPVPDPSGAPVAFIVVAIVITVIAIITVIIAVVVVLRLRSRQDTPQNSVVLQSQRGTTESRPPPTAPLMEGETNADNPPSYNEAMKA